MQTVAMPGFCTACVARARAGHRGRRRDRSQKSEPLLLLPRITNLHRFGFLAIAAVFVPLERVMVIIGDL